MSEAVPGDKVLLYDHGGHNFTYELARDLSAQGTPMVYAYTAGVTAPHGRLVSEGSLQVEPLGKGRTFERYKLPQRVWGEIRLGFESMRLASRTKSRHVITCNMPVIVVALLAAYCWTTRRRFTVWFQDSQAGIAAAMLDSGFALKLIRVFEGWGLRRAERVIAISPAMVTEAKRMGVKDDRLALLPNWAPISQIPVLDKVNDWSNAHGLSETFVFLYSGTLGLKHTPDRLTALARWIKDEGHDAVVLVVSEGPVADSLAEEARRDDLPLQVKPFQPADLLPQVLATADVCIVLLEAHASEFSVPSKVWSYMCAGRPILGSMPLENEAAKVIAEEAKCGLVVDSVAPAERFVMDASLLLQDGPCRAELGVKGREFSDERFDPLRVLSGFMNAVCMPVAARDLEDR